jgi:hypothetical protein
MTTLSTSTTVGVTAGAVVMIGGQQMRVVAVQSGTTLTIKEWLTWRQRTWRYLTTAPYGDATRWMA